MQLDLPHFRDRSAGRTATYTAGAHCGWAPRRSRWSGTASFGARRSPAVIVSYIRLRRGGPVSWMTKKPTRRSKTCWKIVRRRESKRSAFARTGSSALSRQWTQPRCLIRSSTTACWVTMRRSCVSRPHPRSSPNAIHSGSETCCASSAEAPVGEELRRRPGRAPQPGQRSTRIRRRRPWTSRRPATDRESQIPGRLPAQQRVPPRRIADR
jgi:hypothetical protein